MKRSKILQICVNLGFVCVGIIVIANIIISYGNANPLTLYEFWGFGILPIVFGIIFLLRVVEKPKKVRK
ncbi:hypothetical protein [Candidatus Nitrosarchaeum limnium]|nr:hypothetical protein [Candidatus Nitrosarchaeum limnium]